MQLSSDIENKILIVNKQTKLTKVMHYAQGQSLLVCRWEPSQDSIDCVRVYKHAPGFWKMGNMSFSTFSIKFLI